MFALLAWNSISERSLEILLTCSEANHNLSYAHNSLENWTCSFWTISMIVFTFYNVNLPGKKKEKRIYAMLLTSKQVYKLIQRAVILKIFYV